MWQYRSLRDTDAQIVTLSGELDLAAEQNLTEVLLPLTGRPGITAIHVDMAAVTFLDAAIITVLVKANMAATRASRQFRVLRPHRRVRRVLTITGVLPLLSPDPAVDTAE
jgi:anti-anti-sigma factor